MFIKDLFKKNLMNYNFPIILIKASLFIEINELDVYNKADLEDYQKLIGKLMYFTYRIRFKIAFIVRKPSKYHTDPKKVIFK